MIQREVPCHRTFRFPELVRTSAALLCTAGPLSAVEIEAVLLSRGTPTIPGMTNAYRMEVNNKGDWVARVSRTNGDVVVRNGVIIVDNNSPETTSNSIYSFSINNNGDAVSLVYRKEAKVGDYSNGRQVYLNSEVLVTPGQVSLVPELPTGTVYRSIYDAVINDRNEVAVVSVVKEESGQEYQVMSRFTVDTDGSVLSESLVYKDGSIITPGRLANPPRHSWNWEMNNEGEILHYGSLTVPGNGTDQTLFRDWTILFQEDTETAIPGRTSKYVQAAHLNDSGHWVAHVGFEDADVREQMIMRDGEKFLELGDSLRVGGTLKGFIEPVFIDNDRDIYWLGQWTKPDASTGTGLFLNDSLLVESDETEYLGHPLRIDLGGTGGTYGVSDDGRFVLFSAYWNGMAGLFRIAIADPVGLDIQPAAGDPDTLKVSCRPRVDVTHVQLMESPDLLDWTIPAGIIRASVPRPAAGWSPDGVTWTVPAGTSTRFLRATGTRDH